MKVNEIFLSIEGEGKRAGLPCVFIRLFGCNLNCSYCDTRYSCDGKEYSEYSIPQIIGYVKEYKVKNVTVTGGEPLIHPGITKLLDALVKEGYQVNVETNGTQPLYLIDDSYVLRFALNPFLKGGSIFYTMDWKCKSSGMEDKMSMQLVNSLRGTDVLKFVVGSEEDMDGALTVIESMTSDPHIYFSPVFGEINPQDIVQYLLNKQLFDCKVQLQMHKYIWEPTKRGV